MKLEGKVAIVTGSASGMGKAIAQLYAKEGAKVVVSDINKEGAEDVAAGIKADGGTATAVKTNVANREEIDQLISTTVNVYGTLDILVNNAGIMDGFEPAGDIDDEKWEHVFAINTTAVMRSTRKSLSVFLEKGSGVIINIASTGGLNGAHAGATYTASKHAVIGFTKNTGYMYADKGIRCNAIAPGGVATNIAASMKNVNEFGMSRTKAGQAVMPRAGQAEEIANVALFLGSDDSSFINGTVIVADAGWTSAF
ncbi:MULTISPECIES: SDR family oxidoreductase [unclassified Virgibacillus]|uniref:SDR family oxidoreductase n=1 Tax=Virgibacillus TaxID=84406 RepID=UPI00090B6783|nr:MULTISPECIES: SDR family oxidoreductase [unclassified Virgibacillus]API92127.1 3-ketoacyl-ACP reductase [Virgibacillus sp. 6R]MBS7430598.1 SDR family oxidoreductase [Virgibacillus sp. 19R1-5]